jgi:ubiquinone/menaquinone biosynthesis C-methylase UbiE
VTEVERLEAQAALAWPAEKRVLEAIGVGGTVLEIGCGPGAFLERLRELTDALVAVEPNPEYAELARKRVPEADVIEGRAESLPLQHATVDAAVARYVFQHVGDPATVARELRRVLRPGGVLAAIEVDGQLWGIAEPSSPEVAAIHAKVWLAQRERTGDRMVGRRLPAILREAGFVDVRVDVYSVSSLELGLDAFDVHLDPAQLEPALEDGTITAGELATAIGAYRRFRADPDAFVLLTGIVVSGRA